MPKKMEVPCERENIIVKALSKEKKYGHNMYECICKKCGKTYTWPVMYISRYEKSGCDECSRKEKGKNPKRDSTYKEEIGKEYGFLKIVGFAGKKCESKNNNYKTTYMKCLCNKCGEYTEIPLVRLRSGGAKECWNCSKKNLDKYRDKNTEIYCVKGTNVSALRERATNKNNTSGYTGVSYMEAIGKYRAYIMFQRKQYNLGYFEKPEEAHEAYQKAKEKIHGKFLQWYAETYPEQWKKINDKKKKHLDN